MTLFFLPGTFVAVSIANFLSFKGIADRPFTRLYSAWYSSTGQAMIPRPLRSVIFGGSTQLSQFPSRSLSLLCGGYGGCKEVAKNIRAFSFRGDPRSKCPKCPRRINSRSPVFRIPAQQSRNSITLPSPCQTELPRLPASLALSHLRTHRQSFSPSTSTNTSSSSRRLPIWCIE